MASSTSQPVTLATGTADIGDVELKTLTEEVHRGRLTGLRQYLARTREQRDWQDRIHMITRIAPKASVGVLDEACEAEPNSADVFLIRCAYFAELAKTMRGTGTSDQVTREKYENSADCIKAALENLDKAAELDSEDPTAHALILPCLTIFGPLAPRQHAEFQKAIALAPDLVPAYFPIVTVASQRWQGSHEQSLQFARKAMTKAGPGSDMAVCLFWAHQLVQSHYSYFDKNPRAAKLYLQNVEVRRELDEAFDEWTKPPYVARRSSIPYLRHAGTWYKESGNQARLKQVRTFTKDKPGNAAAGQKTRSKQGSGSLFSQVFRIFTGK